MLSRAGSSWRLPASKGTKTAAKPGKSENLNVANPVYFRRADMVTTSVQSAGDRTRGVWKFLTRA